LRGWNDDPWASIDGRLIHVHQVEFQSRLRAAFCWRELTRSNDIKLNERISLLFQIGALSMAHRAIFPVRAHSGKSRQATIFRLVALFF